MADLATSTATREPREGPTPPREVATPAMGTAALGAASPPRCLVLSPWWPATETDPLGSFVRDQASALLSAGCDVRAAVLRLRKPFHRARGAAALRAEGLPARRVLVHEAPWAPYGPAYDFLLGAWTRLVRAAVARQGAWARTAVVVVHTQDLAVPTARALNGTGVPFVVVAHGLEPDSPRYRRADRSRAYRAALAAAGRVVAVGPGLARHLRLEAPAADVRVVGNGYDRALVARVLAAPSPPAGGGPRLVSVSNLALGKGVHLTLEALGARARRGEVVPDYDVVGDGPERGALAAQARRLGLAERVRFRGALAHDEALSVVRGAAGFVLPSAPEAWGIAYLEAMALGVPPVAILGEGPAAFVRDGATGLLVERTAKAVEAAVARLVDEPATSRCLGEAATLAARALDWDASARALIAVLPAPRASRLASRPATWVSLYEEPTPYVTAKQDAVEAAGCVRLSRAWVRANASQAWGSDAAFREADVLDRPSRVAKLALALVRGRVAGLHAGGWSGSRATPLLLAAAWLGRRPLAIESDTHVSHSRGAKAAVRRAYLRCLNRRVRAWLPGGTPQAEHLRAVLGPRARIVVERMTTDTATLLSEAARAGAAAGRTFRASHGIPPDAPLVLYVGRLAPEKGIGDLVEALARLRSDGVDAHLVLLGPGELDAAARARLPADRVHAVGRVPWRALVPAYLAADVLALPSRFEPWGLVVNEALCLGCPVVATDAVGAARDLVGATGAGVVVPAADPAALASGLRSVIDAGGRESPAAQRGLAAMRDWSVERAGEAVAAALSGGNGSPC